MTQLNRAVKSNRTACMRLIHADHVRSERGRSVGYDADKLNVMTIQASKSYVENLKALEANMPVIDLKEIEAMTAKANKQERT